MNDSSEARVTFLNPAGMHRNPAFSQAALLSSNVRMLYIGAQTAVNGEGTLVGQGDIAGQTEQVLRNLELCLEAGGARRDDLVSWNIYVAQGEDIAAAAAVGIRWMGDTPNPPLNTVMFVAGFWPVEILIMIEAVAVLPGD